MAGRTFLRSETINNSAGDYNGGFTPLKALDQIGEGDETPRASEFLHQIPFKPSSGHALRINTAAGWAVTPSLDTPTTDDGNDHGGVSLAGMTRAYEAPRKQETMGDIPIMGSHGNVGQGSRHGLGSGIGSIDAIVRSPVLGPQVTSNHVYMPGDNLHEKERFSGDHPRSYTPGAGGLNDQSSFSRQGNRDKHSAYVDQKRSVTPGGSRGQQRVFSRSAYGKANDEYHTASGRITPAGFDAQAGYGMHSGSNAQVGYNRRAHMPPQPGAPFDMAGSNGFGGYPISGTGHPSFDGARSPFPGSFGFAANPNSSYANYSGGGDYTPFSAMQDSFPVIERPQSAHNRGPNAATMPNNLQNHGDMHAAGLGLMVSRPRASQQGPYPRAGSHGGSDSSGHDSVHDSTRAAHAGRAKDLARMIMSGACDPGEEYDYGRKNIYGPMTYYGSKKAGEISPTKYRAARKTQLHNDRAILAEAAKRERDTKGSAAAFIGVEIRLNPDWLYQVQLGFKPTADQFFDALPITEPCRHIAPSSAGVVRLMGFPFEAPRAEVTAFLCRQAKIVPQPLGSPYFAVHVVMERSTGKTNDAFIELASEAEAVRVVGQADKRTLNGRPQKMGDRTVEVVMSCQEDLMHEIFGKAKKIVWSGNTPVVSTQVECYYPGIPSEGFSGFVGTEELHEMLQRCEHPQRYFHITRHQPRLFEHWISTLVKYPWHALECVTIAERDRLFKATMKIVAALINALQYAAKEPYNANKVTFGTLRELTVTVLTCPGFSEVQKAEYVRFMFEKDLAAVCDPKGTNLKFGGMRTISGCWPFKVLAIDPAAPKETVEYFMYLVREASQAKEDGISLAERHRRRIYNGPVNGPFGNITIDYKNAKTIKDVGELELDVVEELLRRVLE